MRLRINYSPCLPGLILTDTPRPHCWSCHGHGGHHLHALPEASEWENVLWRPCPCWDYRRTWTLLPLPQWAESRMATLRLRRRGRQDDYSPEPPF